jgi:hypothetical protein
VAEEVENILQMFRELQRAKDTIADPTILESPWFQLAGSSICRAPTSHRIVL